MRGTEPTPGPSKRGATEQGSSKTCRERGWFKRRCVPQLPAYHERPDSIVYGREGRLLHDGGCSSWLLAFGPQSDNNKP